MSHQLILPRQALVRSTAFATAIIASSMCGSVALKAQTQIPVGIRNQVAGLAKTCREDYAQFCNGVRPGGGRILACLKANAEKLSVACRGALAEGQKL